LKEYYRLTKPGIVYGNDLPAIGAFLLASKGHVDFVLFLAMLGGLSLIIASSCVFNNYIDMDVDSKMARTKKRPLVAGTISVRNALIYAVTLGLAGGFILGAFTNMRTLLTAMFGMFAYTVLYSFWKRRSSFGTVVGSVSGAVPPVVGYLAVSDRFDSGAWVLFAILTFWQMPHFYAIAIYRSKDYKAAGIPVLPLRRGLLNTKVQILLYIIAFTFAVAALADFGYGGYTYFGTVMALSIYWLWLAAKGFKAKDENRWARKMFGASLIVITVFSVVIALNSWVP
jgi:protoheme IX farnesyltransferase